VSRHMDFFVLYQFRFYFCGILNSVLSEGGNRSRVMLTSVWRVMAWSNRKCSKFLGWKLLLQFFFLFAACKSNVEIGGMRKETVAKTTKQKVRLGWLIALLTSWSTSRMFWFLYFHRKTLRPGSLLARHIFICYAIPSNYLGRCR